MIIVKATSDIDLLNKKYLIKKACHGEYDLWFKLEDFWRIVLQYYIVE
jgi:hypothetical protein